MAIHIKSEFLAEMETIFTRNNAWKLSNILFNIDSKILIYMANRNPGFVLIPKLTLPSPWQLSDVRDLLKIPGSSMQTRAGIGFRSSMFSNF